MKKRVLVVGGNGFVGCSLVPRLAELPDTEVVVFDRQDTAANPAVRQLAAAVEIGDMTDSCVVERVVARHRPATVYHLACATVPTADPAAVEVDVSVNLRGTVTLLDAVCRHGVEELVFLSSGGTVYGIVDDRPVSEEAPLRPVSSYGIMKACSEWYAALYRRLYGLRTLILRPSNFYGEYHSSPRQGLINVALRAIAAGRPVTVFGDGKIVRDYIYVQDAVEAIVALRIAGIRDGVFNVGSGVGCSIEEVLHVLREVVGPFDVRRAPERPCDVPRLVLDVSRLAGAISIRRTPLREGVAATWRWIQKGCTSK